MKVGDILKRMEKITEEKPLPQLLMPKVVSEWISGQIDERRFVMQLLNIPENVAAAVGSIHELQGVL